MKSEDLIKRTKGFAHRCVKLSVNLPKSDLGNHIRRQLIRCSTSVAANYRATIDVKVHDHLIIAGNNYYSFVDNNII